MTDLYVDISGVVQSVGQKIKKEVREEVNKMALDSIREAVQGASRVFDEKFPKLEIEGQVFTNAGEAFSQLALNRAVQLIKEKTEARIQKKDKEISFDDFLKLDIRTGVIVSVDDLDQWKDYVTVTVDVGYDKLLGLFQKGANFDISSLLNRTVCIVVNIKDIKKFRGIEFKCQVLTTRNDKGDITPIYANGIGGGFVVR